MGGNLNNKRIKCTICGTEYGLGKYCCPKCKYPALSFTRKTATQNGCIKSYKIEKGYEKKQIASRDTDKRNTVKKQVASIETGQKDAVKKQTSSIKTDKKNTDKIDKVGSNLPFFWIAVFLAGFLGLLDGSFFDINVLNFYNDQYLGLHQQMECYMSYSGLAFIVVCFLYEKSRKLVGTILMLIMISCEVFDIVDSIALYHLHDGAIISMVLSHMFILVPIIWTIALLIQDMFAPSKQTL